MERLLGIGADGARGGWLTVACFGDDPGSLEARRTEVALCRSVADVVAIRGGGDAIVGIDIPIGLPDSVGLRPCDRRAQELLGHRRSTVFAPPSRPLLSAASYAAARATIAELRRARPDARSLSAQSFALVPKISEVDGWLRAQPEAQAWLFEVHPEPSFHAMLGTPLPDKKSAAGQAIRIRLLQQRFPDLLTRSRRHPCRRGRPRYPTCSTPTRHSPAPCGWRRGSTSSWEASPTGSA